MNIEENTEMLSDCFVYNLVCITLSKLLNNVLQNNIMTEYCLKFIEVYKAYIDYANFRNQTVELIMSLD